MRLLVPVRISRLVPALGLGALWISCSSFALDLEFSAGPAVRYGLNLKVSGTSYAQSMGWHAARSHARIPSLSSGAPPSDHLSQYANRSFDDGFVNMDPSTVDFGGDTWYWGYENALQYDPAADTLSFHRQAAWSVSGEGERVAQQTLRDEGIDESTSFQMEGFEAMAGVGLASRGAFRFGLRGGMLGLFNLDETINASPYEESIRTENLRVTETYQVDETYVYDLMGVTPPSAPYSGTYLGPGPLLPNLPVSQEQEAGSSGRSTQITRRSQYTAHTEVKMTAEGRLLAFWLGPQCAWIPKERAAFFVLPRLTINHFQMEADRQEDWMVTGSDGRSRVDYSWRDSLDEGQWRWGVGLVAGVEVDIWRNVFGYACGGYDWVDAYSWELGPNTIDLDASGVSVSAALGLYL